MTRVGSGSGARATVEDAAPAPDGSSGWALGCWHDSDSGPQIVIGDRLSRAELAELRDLVVPFDSIKQRTTFEVLEANYRSLTSLFHFLALTGKFPFDHAGMSKTPGLVTTCVVNYLTAARLYLDAASHTLSQNFGVDSRERARFLRATHDAFDSSVGYRFTYHMRNAVLHTGSMPLTTSISLTDDGKTRARLLSDRDSLLSGYNKWHSLVRTDLEAGPSSVDILALLHEGWGSLLEVENVHLAILGEACATRADALEAFLSRCPEGTDSRPILLRLEADGRAVRPQVALNAGITYLPDRPFVDSIKGATASGPLVMAPAQSMPSIPPTGLDPRQEQDVRRAVGLLSRALTGRGPEIAHAALNSMPTQTEALGLVMGQIVATHVVLQLASTVTGTPAHELLHAIFGIYASGPEGEGL